MKRNLATRLLALTLAATPLAACDRNTGSADPITPEFYVYEGKPYCLVELVNNGTDAAKRRGEVFDLLSSFYQQTRGWQQKLNIVGVDYMDFKKMTMVVYAACSDKPAVTAAIAEAGAISKNFTGAEGGDKALISDAKMVTDFPGGIARFEHFNPGTKPDVCMMQYNIPAGAGDPVRITNAIARTAIEFHFPVGDFASEGQSAYFLLSRYCNEKDKLAANMEAAFARRGIQVGKIIVREKTPNVAAYTALMPPQPAQK